MKGTPIQHEGSPSVVEPSHDRMTLEELQIAVTKFAMITREYRQLEESDLKDLLNIMASMVKLKWPSGKVAEDFPVGGYVFDSRLYKNVMWDPMRHTAELRTNEDVVEELERAYSNLDTATEIVRGLIKVARIRFA